MLIGVMTIVSEDAMIVTKGMMMTAARDTMMTEIENATMIETEGFVIAL